MKKRLLILGASKQQIPIIEYAKSIGCYIITCDYLPNNLGHSLSNEYHNISTIDKESILALAKSLKIDSILSFANEKNELSATYVANKMNLICHTLKSTKILSNKNLFRHLLHSLNLPVPKNTTINNLDNIDKKLSLFSFPAIIKPVDSSGSRGVFKINTIEDVIEKYPKAIAFSNSGEIIIEEYISGDFKQIHGDIFIKNSEVIFYFIGDHYYNEALNNLVPISTTFPSAIPLNYLIDLKNTVQLLIKKIGYTDGSLNIEARIQKGKVYIIDIGPRNGGNFMPLLAKYATGFDFAKELTNFSLNIKSNSTKNYPIKGFFSYLVIHSEKSGILKSISFSSEIEPLILEVHYNKAIGDEIKPFVGANYSVGIILLKYKSKEQMHSIVNNHLKHVKVILQH